MKTNPIGVRFRTDILEKLKTEHNAETPQKALNFLERFFVSHHALAKDLKQPLRSNVESAPQKEILKPEKMDNSALLEQIKAIKAEKCPEHRSKTQMGRKSWEMDQANRIKELESKLK